MYILNLHSNNLRNIYEVKCIHGRDKDRENTIYERLVEKRRILSKMKE